MTIEDFRDQRVILLTTLRKDGTPVGTPVNFAAAGSRGYVRTWATSGKAKRIANNPNVTVAPSTYRGSATGPAVPAHARALTGDEARTAGRVIDRKYPIIQRWLVPMAHRLRKVEPVVYELIFGEPGDAGPRPR